MSHGLDPSFNETVDKVIMGANIATGYDWIITCGYRSPEEQDKLYSQGRTAQGQRVTNAKAWQSPHQYRLAADLAPMKDGKIHWMAPDEVWKQMADVAVHFGLTAGYYFKSFKDMPHIEDKNWKELKGGH